MSDTRHILTIEALGKPRCDALLKTADSYSKKPPAPLLDGKTVVLLFFESSTRTRVSFEMAAKQLGANVVHVQSDYAATVKGESLKDTLETLSAMNPAVIIFRHPDSGAAEIASRYTDVPIVNAGDGAHAHPTQALIDVLTAQHKKVALDGANVVICGDILHSRVARSSACTFAMQGANVTCVGPATMLPRDSSMLHAAIDTELEPHLASADILMLLRIQHERLKGPYLPSNKDYALRYGLNQQRLEMLKKEAVILHPGPIHRGVEIAGNVAEMKDKHAILDQVALGIPVRQAVLCDAVGVK